MYFLTNPFDIICRTVLQALSRKQEVKLYIEDKCRYEICGLFCSLSNAVRGKIKEYLTVAVLFIDLSESFYLENFSFFHIWYKML